MNTLSRHLAIWSTLALVGTTSCHSSRTYEATVEVLRISPVRRDARGTTLSTDFEISYVECPGAQIEVIRGGREFSSCIQQMKVGDKVRIKLEHRWNPEGFYDYQVFDVQGCARPPDPEDEASYKMVRECVDWKVNGVRVGFQCNYTGKKELNQKCPWFRRN